MRIALLVVTFVAGLGAGICFDIATVKLPTRHRIGPVAYANFARGNDLGNGLKVYPFVVAGGGLLVIALTIAARVSRQPSALQRPLYAAALSVVGVLAAKAAPIMRSFRTTPNDGGVLADKLDLFAYWHGWRTAFQIAAFVALLWALALRSPRPS